MKEINQRLLSLTATPFIVCLLFNSCAKTPIPTDPVNTCPVQASEFNTWFEGGIVNLNGVANPADSVNFPDTPNCSFYKWSEHMFLWLTSPTPPSYGGGGGRIFNSGAFYDISPLDTVMDRTFIPHTALGPNVGTLTVRVAKTDSNQLPLVIDSSGNAREVERPQLGPSGRPMVQDDTGKKVEIQRVTRGEKMNPIFIDVSGQPIPGAKPIITRGLDPTKVVQKFTTAENQPIFIDSFGGLVDVEQGQADGAVLMAQNGSLVYYKSTVNDVYAYFLTGVKDNVITPGTQFPTTATELTQIKNFAIAHGKPSPEPFPDPNALAVEIKTAWVESAGLPNPGDYITMTATIPTYDQSNPHMWVPTGQKVATMALLSVHAVGSTKGHREMIWATFENLHNAPNATYQYNSTSGVKTVNPDFSSAFVFCSANPDTSHFNEPHMHEGPNGTIVSDPNFSISASNIIRGSPWGAAENVSPNPVDATAAASNSELIAINNSVRTMLNNTDIRRNYILTGATWTVNGGAPSTNFGNPGNTGTPTGKVVGANQLANSDLETFLQSLNPSSHATTFSSTSNNCFLCHTTNQVDISHLFYTPGTGHQHGLKPLF